MKKLITFLLLLFLLPQRVQAAEADESALAAVESATASAAFPSPTGTTRRPTAAKRTCFPPR